MPQSATPSFLDVSLRPNRSLTPTGFAWLMGTLGLISAVAGVWFVLKGAWPIMGFFGLDMALLYWAFKVSYRRGELTERIRIDDSAMTVQRMAPGRQDKHWSFHPSWVRVDMQRPDEHSAQLHLRQQGQDLEIGAFLPPKERSEVASQINDGLEKRRRALLD
ncbi:MAG: DUF2244 domain-containing protein [Pseudomonadota bacterium]